MAVNLNLLSGDAAEGRPDVSWRFAAGLSLFLLAVTFTVVLYEYYLFNSLYQKRIIAEADLRSAAGDVSMLNAKIAGAEASLNEVEGMLDFMLCDARIGEMLSLLTVCAAEEAFVESLEVTAGGMMLHGSAKSEHSITEFYKALISSGLFASADKHCYMSGSGFGFDFTLQCDSANTRNSGVTDDR